MRIKWSCLAVDDWIRIFDSIEQDDPLAAAFVDERTMEQKTTLGQFPQCGRQGRVVNTREFVDIRTPLISMFVRLISKRIFFHRHIY